MKRHPNLLMFSRVFLALLLVVTIAEISTVSAAETKTDTTSVNSHKWGLSFGGVIMSGRFTPALLPQSADFSNSMTEMETPFGFGLSMDYSLSPKMRLFVDGNFYTFRKQVGIAGEYSTSDWVWEMNDYETRLIGPFEEDAYFYMQTIGFRIGVKYDLPMNGARPWFGAGVGIYAWKADYMTADRTGSWGSESGTVAGPTFMVGVDFILSPQSKSPMMITFFGDFLAPVVNPVIENLFNDGWTYNDVGGCHVMGPYRIGMSIGFLR